jgi:hypothetical protein
MLKRAMLALVCCAMLEGVVAPQAVADTVITVTPTPTQKLFRRGNLYFACTTVASLYTFLDTGRVRAGCGFYAMTAARRRSYYEAIDGTDYDVYDFMIGGYYYFTFNHD